MWTRKRTAPASEQAGALVLGRRAFLRGLAAVAVLLGLPRAWPVRADEAAGQDRLAPETVALLERSGFVYVSPLLRGGSESTCHGEVWYGWLDGAVLLVTASTSWKARARQRGLDRARVWVGDHGRWNRMLGTSDAFRQAPSFEARVALSRDEDLLDRLMGQYREKYPDEIGRWEDRFRSGFASGERVLLRYEPVAASEPGPVS